MSWQDTFVLQHKTHSMGWKIYTMCICELGDTDPLHKACATKKNCWLHFKIDVMILGNAAEEIKEGQIVLPELWTILYKINWVFHDTYFCQIIWQI